jgi:hypothetical protein
MRSVVRARVVLVLVGILAGSSSYAQFSGPYEKRVPLIYGTDLFHPHDDPDDHLDIATLFSLREIDVRAIVLDLGLRQQKKPGRVPVEQILSISGRRVPYGIGLADPLQSAEDKATAQPREFQGGVELILKVLHESDQPVHMLFAGSLRDVAAAFNREPELLKQRTGSIHVNIGSSQTGGTEWNVGLDPQAYRRIMSSGLPVYWYPCMPMSNEWSSHWRVERYGDLMAGAPLRLQNFILYMLHQVDTAEIDPLAVLQMDLRPYRKMFWDKPKDMWCTASLIQVAGRKIVKAGTEWVAVPPSYAEDTSGENPFALVPVRVELHTDGSLAGIDRSVQSSNIQMIRVPDPALYARIMTSCLRRLFEEFAPAWNAAPQKP